MKKVLFIIATLAINVGISFAQQKETHTQTVDKKFINLDKSKISTHILYDRVLPFASLSTFCSEKDNTTSTQRFIQGFSELSMASYMEKSAVTTQNISDAVTAYNAKRRIPFGLLNYAFNTLDTLSIKKGILRLGEDSTLFEIKGNPYVDNQLQMFVALQKTPLYTGENMFIIAPELIFTNQSNQIESININFGENNQTAIFNMQNIENKEISINYTGGIKTLTYTLILKNGKKQVYSSTLDINVARERNEGVCFIPSAVSNHGDANIIANIPFTSYDNTQPLDSQYGKGELGYYYASGKNCGIAQTITKPIIILDGFDPQDKRDITGIYTKLDYGNSLPPQNLANDLRSASVTSPK